MVTYSHSRLSSFENCPLQFRYRYLDRIPVEREGIEAFAGKRVHEILERLYHHVGRYGRPPSLSQVLERFRKDWEQRWHDRIQIVREENPPEHYRRAGERCLENYYRSWYPFDATQTVALEQRVELVLDERGRYRAQGIVDRLVRTGPGRYEIHDYKTGAFVPSAERLARDRQLALYQIGIEQTYADAEEVQLVWHYLLFNKTIRQRRTEQQLDSVRLEAIELIDRIETAQEYPARPGPLCRWCDFNGICPEFTGARVRAQPPALAEAPLPVAPPPPYGIQLSLL